MSEKGDSPKTRPWTPGPWTGLYAEDDGTITLGHEGTESRFTWADEALAVTAPELYEALESACETIRGRLHGDEGTRCSCAACKPLEDALDVSEAALKKARGE